ncbi:MJ0042 family finger-like domain protein [Sulfitobacter noctilucicola]|uniref:Putative Zn finger-like uncharacterized protein n=1 Tax=Sulfitobacter noctilucicola TaxID=1342301 RepID=A0A7W6Q4N5_9RHOB|nr:zinc-ribbon domain-containing protein [Sulfitobacter noctilucicola]KIN63657.1 MJ0042 family finger-like domain protein [Sulfitobacter noctilucicola]MBB4174833.1 putative Zn finger-like uncharacterized protein [Sulfitobacter noctilucicola]
MRLTCPNCDAQYEVPDEVVPTAGRDVQCSNCGQTWFQYHPDNEPEEAQDIEETLSVDAPAPDEEVSPPPPPVLPSTEPVRKELDPAVADILRQEAEAEFEARRKRQSEPLESQPELGLDAAEQPPATPIVPQDDPDTRAHEAKKRMARMRGEPEPKSAEAAAAAAAISSRRELLPDIEEINSTLRNDTVSNNMDADAREELGAGGGTKKKGSFKRGFLTVVLIALVLLLLYIYADQIAQAVPALEGIMTSYVSAIDAMRTGLDSQVRSLLGWLDSKATQSEG